MPNPMDPMDREDDEGAVAVVLGKEEAEEAQCTVVAVVPRNAEAGKRPTPDAQESSRMSSRTESQPLPKAPEGTRRHQGFDMLTFSNPGLALFVLLCRFL